MAIAHSPESTRRPGLIARPVRLADGRDWGFVAPTVRLVPVFQRGTDEAGRPVIAASPRVEAALQPAIQARMDAVSVALDAGVRDDLLRSFLALVAELLLSCHDLDPEVAVALLDLDPREFPRLIDEALAAVGGADPTQA